MDSKPHSRMWYRIGAVRNMTGGRKTQPATKMNDRLKEVLFLIFFIFHKYRSLLEFQLLGKINFSLKNPVTINVLDHS